MRSFAKFEIPETVYDAEQQAARQIGCAELADSDPSRLRHAIWIALLIVAVAGWVVWRVVA